jgi:hypothetical protein
MSIAVGIGTGLVFECSASELQATTMVVFAGQSNAHGWAVDPQNSTAIANGLAYEVYPSGSDAVVVPLGITGFGRGGKGGAWRPFSAAWTAAFGGVALVVNAASGGSSIIDANKSTQTGDGVGISGGTWDLAAGANSLYNLIAVPRINAARISAAANGFAIHKIIVVWVQGERDAGYGSLSQATYTAKLVELIDNFVADFGIDGFFISALGTNGASDYTSGSKVRNGQADAAASRSSVAAVAYEGAVDFYAAGWMVDTLHYTQAGYNAMGSGLVSGIQAFLPPFTLPSPPDDLFINIAESFPAIVGWNRLRIKTKATTFAPLFYSVPLTPYGPTWVDGSGSNALKSTPTSSGPAWTFPDSSEKNVCVYVSDQSGANTFYYGGVNDSYVEITIPDAGTHINSIDFNSAQATGFTITDNDVLSISPSYLRSLSIGTSDGSKVISSPNVSITNTILDAHPNLTSIVVDGLGIAALDFTKIPNATYVSHRHSGLSVSDVNAALIALDANGKSNGTVALGQYKAGIYPSAPPSGGGATAKTNLQGKGWNVYTD